jgi:PAS domain S-box-containing protein
MSPPDEKKLRESSLRLRAEAMIQHTLSEESRSDRFLSPEESKKILQELRVHQIELEMQNDTLRQAQDELEDSRDRYVDLYDFAPVGYLSITAHGMIEEINLAATRLLSMERKALLQRPFTSLVIAEDESRWLTLFLTMMEQNGKDSVEVTLQRGDGSVFPAQLDCATQKVGAGDTALRIALTDITRRKQIEATSFRNQQHLKAMVKERGAELLAIGKQLLAAEELERRTIAVDLHDDLGQDLAVAKLKLEAIMASSDVADNDKLQRQLAAVTILLDRCNKSVRSLSSQLSPPVLHQYGLGAALDWLSEEMQRTYGLNVKVYPGEAVTLDEIVAATLFRIVRELLINISKHAQVSEAEVGMLVDAETDNLEITVSDDGVGFDVARTLDMNSSTHSSYGLFSIKQRIDFIGGQMLIDSHAGHGTIVLITLALPPETGNRGRIAMTERGEP